MDERTLREKARAALQTGELPQRHPSRTWSGPGAGIPCSLCDLPVSHDETEFAIQFVRDGGPPTLDGYHFHTLCYAAWEVERVRHGPRRNTRRGNETAV